MGNKNKRINPVLFQKELEERLPKGKQLRRIIEEDESEDLLTWNLFSTLRKSKPYSRWLLPFLKRSFANLDDLQIQSDLLGECLDKATIKLWVGKRYAPTFSPPQEREDWHRKYLGEKQGEIFREWSRKPGKIEGSTEVDLMIRSDRVLIYVEAKYLSDIGTDVSYDPRRDQIVRNIDVGTYHAQRSEPRRDFFFVLLTPKWDDEYEERSRLYWYKMHDYRQHPELLRAKLPHRDATIKPDCEYPIDFQAMARRIGWAYWADVISLAHREVRAGHVHDISPQEWQKVMEDFQYKGLI